MRKKELRKMCNRVAALVLSTCLVAGALPETVFATGGDNGYELEKEMETTVEAVVEEPIVENPQILKEGELTYRPFEDATYELKYTVGEDGITITGSLSGVFWGQLVLPEEIDGIAVVAIGTEAFKGNYGLSGDLVIPDSVTEIGDGAFWNCSGLIGNLVIPDGVTSIGDEAFVGCSGFSGDLVIPDSVTEIGDSAFQACSGFSGDLVIPDSVTEMGDYAFAYCFGFNGDLVIGDGVESIGAGAFRSCGFNGDLVIGDGVESIGSYAFFYCIGLNGELVIPDGVTSIGDEAFRYCGFNGDLVIPDSVTEIGDYAFYTCFRFDGELVIPDSVITIGSAAFCGCNFNGELVIPDSVITIGSGAFSGGCNFNGELVIPDSVTRIGGYAFNGCSGFDGELVIPDSVTRIGDYAFSGCSGFDGELVIPDSVTSIGDYAFSGCSGFDGELVIPDSVTSIGDYAFYNCSGFSGDLAIPDSVTSIGDYAFKGCSKISCIGLDYDCINPIKHDTLRMSYSNVSKNHIIFANSDSGSSIISYIGEDTGELVIPEMFSGNGKVTQICPFAYKGCSGFTGDVIIPDSITQIGYGAFKDCSGLSGNIKMTYSVTDIGDRAFEITDENGDLLPITIYAPKGSYGEKYAYENGYDYKEWNGYDLLYKVINNEITITGYEGTIKGMLNIPEKIEGTPVRAIGDNAFRDATEMEGDLVIPPTITSIGEAAFWNCSSLNGNIVVPGSVTEIGDAAFEFWGEELEVVMASESESSATEAEQKQHMFSPEDSAGHQCAVDNDYDYTKHDGGDLNDDSFEVPASIAEDWVVPGDEYWVTVLDKNATPIKNANLTVTKDDELTIYDYEDGIIKIPVSEESCTIEILANYDKYVGSLCKEVSGGEVGFLKIIDAVNRKTSGIRDINIPNLPTAKNQNNVPFQMKINHYGTQPDYYQIMQGERVVFQKTTADFQVDLKKVLTPNGGPVVIRTLQKKEHKEQNDDIKMIELARKTYSPSYFGIRTSKVENKGGTVKLGGDGITFEVAESVPIFGGSEMTMNIPLEMPFEIETSDDEVEIYIGIAKDLLEDSDDSKKTDMWKELQDKFNNERISAEISDMTKTGVAAGLDVSATAAGYGKGKVVNGIAELEVGIMVEMKASNGKTWYTMIGPVPVYVEVNGELGGSVNPKGTLEINMKTGDVKAELDKSIELYGELQLGAGAGLNDVLCLEVDGTGRLQYNYDQKLGHEFGDDSEVEKIWDGFSYEHNLKLGLEADLKAVLLFLEYKLPIAQIAWRLYPTPVEIIDDETGGIWDKIDIVNASNYNVLTRYYLLENELSDIPAVVQSDGTSGENEQVVINGLYPDAKPQLLVYDGVSYVFYLDDLTERGVEDKTALMYRKQTNGAWSEPIVVHDDGTADFDYEAAVGADGIYVVWQNATKSMTGVSTLEGIVGSLGLQAARVDADSVTLLKTPETTKGLAALSPSVVCSGSDVWACWYENSNNDLLNNYNGKNVFYTQSLSDAQNGERQTLGETGEGVATADFGMLGDALCGAYTEDRDRDMSTYNDREVCFVRNGATERVTQNSVLDSNPQFGMLDGTQVVVYYSDGNFVSTDGSTSTPVWEEGNNTVSDNFLFVSENGNPVIVWKDAYIMSEQAGQALTATHYKDGAWTESYQAAFTENSLVAFTALAEDADTTRLMFTVRDELNGQEITRLHEKTAKGEGKPCWTKVEYEENDYVPGEEFPMSITLNNSSSYAVEEYEIVIRDAEGVQIFSQASEKALGSNEEIVVALSGFAPEDKGDLTSYTLQICVDGRVCDTHTFTLGGIDFSLEDEIEYDESDEILTLQLRNDSKIAGDVKLSILAEGEEEPLYEKEFTALASGTNVSYIYMVEALWEQTDSDTITIVAESLGRQEENLFDNKVVLCRATEGAESVEWVSVELEERRETLTAGDTLQLTAVLTLEDASDKTLSWVSSNPDCVAVDENGLVTAKEAGSGVVRVYTADGLSDSCEITVKKAETKVTDVTLSAKKLWLLSGEERNLSVDVAPAEATDKELIWTSSNDEVVSVVDGTIKAHSVGTSVVRARTSNGRSATCVVTVVDEPIAVTGIALNKTTATLKVGEDTTLAVSYTPATTTQKDVTWKSSNEVVATVVDGKVTAVGAGTAIITVTSTSDATLKATCTVTVEEAKDDVIAIEKLELDKTAATLKVGEGTTLAVSYTPATTTQKDVTWKSSNEAVATVVDGKVTAVGAGTAIITVTSTSDATLKASCTVTVEAAKVDPIINPFGDVKESDWYYKYALFAYENGLMTGKGTTDDGKVKFDPANTITRAEFVQMLYSKENKPSVEYAGTFTDVPEGQWYTNAIMWAYDNGIVRGKAADLFDVNGKITRQEIALILYKYAAFKQYDVTIAEDTDLSSFLDDETVANWGLNGIKWAVQNGVISGKGSAKDGYAIAPNGNATRAEAATMMRSFMVAYEGVAE